MEKEFILKLRLILSKYETLLLNNFPVYQQLKSNIDNIEWVSKITNTLNKVKNSDKIFNISKEINKYKNDQRVLEMFAEFDVADRLVNTKFFGSFQELEYLEKNNQSRQPDFIAKQGKAIAPVEVKLLSPQGLGEKKFFQKMIDKINNHALQQLNSYYEKNKFQNGMIFIWTHSPVQLHNIEYHDLEKYFKEKVNKPVFNVTIVCILYGIGLWDFYL